MEWDLDYASAISWNPGSPTSRSDLDRFVLFDLLQRLTEVANNILGLFNSCR